MKRIFFFLIFALLDLPAALSAQETTTKGSWRDGDDGYWDKKNMIGFGVSLLSFNSFYNGFLPITISYDRKLKHNVTLGGLIDVSNHFFTLATDMYEVYDVVGFAGVKAGYDLKIGRNTCLRFGLGAGAGIHHIYEVQNGMCRYGCPELPSCPTTRVLPHLLVDIHWVFRVGRHCELIFAPLFFSPSQLIFSPWANDYYPKGYYGGNFAPVRFAARF